MINPLRGAKTRTLAMERDRGTIPSQLNRLHASRSRLREVGLAVATDILRDARREVEHGIDFDAGNSSQQQPAIPLACVAKGKPRTIRVFRFLPNPVCSLAVAIAHFELLAYATPSQAFRKRIESLDRSVRLARE